jgi:hypothetical protein
MADRENGSDRGSEQPALFAGTVTGNNRNPPLFGARHHRVAAQTAQLASSDETDKRRWRRMNEPRNQNQQLDRTLQRIVDRIRDEPVPENLLELARKLQFLLAEHHKEDRDAS